MAPTVNICGLYDAMLQIAKSENMVDRLELAEFAGCAKQSLLKNLVYYWPHSGYYSSSFSIFVRRLIFITTFFY